MRLRIQIPQVVPDVYQSPPERCPACGNNTWHGHGWKASPFYRLKLLTLRLAANWPRLTLTETCREADGSQFIPATNNMSEQSIGLNIKERYRTMRGYKSRRSVKRVSSLTAYLREEGQQALIELLAA